jgi:hypothetical protein
LNSIAEEFESIINSALKRNGKEGEKEKSLSQALKEFFGSPDGGFRSDAQQDTSEPVLESPNRYPSLTSTSDHWDEWSKRVDWAKRFRDSQRQAESYSTETKTTTNITRNPDGSIYKETITTEHLPDGTSKTTRVVDATPAITNGQPPRDETFPSEPKTAPAENPWHWPKGQNGDPSSYEKQPTQIEKEQPRMEIAKKEGNWTWWFWSKK